VDEYLVAGARRVWVADPQIEKVVEDDLDGGDVLPGRELLHRQVQRPP